MLFFGARGEEEMPAVIAFPPSPVLPAEFFSDFLLKAFAEAGLPPGARASACSSASSSPEGGGEWVFEVENATLRVTQAPRDATAFTVRQSVAIGAARSGRAAAASSRGRRCRSSGPASARLPPRPGWRVSAVRRVRLHSPGWAASTARSGCRRRRARRRLAGRVQAGPG